MGTCLWCPKPRHIVETKTYALCTKHMNELKTNNAKRSTRPLLGLCRRCRNPVKPNKTMCRRCNHLTKDFRKINKIKIPLCSESCSIEYVLRRFLNTRYNYNKASGTLYIESLN